MAFCSFLYFYWTKVAIIIDNGVIEDSHGEMKEEVQYVAESNSEDLNRRR